MRLFSARGRQPEDYHARFRNPRLLRTLGLSPSSSSSSSSSSPHHHHLLFNIDWYWFCFYTIIRFFNWYWLILILFEMMSCRSVTAELPIFTEARACSLFTLLQNEVVAGCRRAHTSCAESEDRHQRQNDHGNSLHWNFCIQIFSFFINEL